jgi:hypothetical protein
LLGLLGGPPQHETWDPKPGAPAEVRGLSKPIATSLPGLSVGELLPRTARVAHHCAILRAVSTRDNAHSSSGYYMLTGQPHTPPNVENARPGAPNDWPSVASVVRHLRQQPARLPAAVVLPEHIWNDGQIPWPGQDAGWLGRANDPWLLMGDPAAPTFQVPALTLPADLNPHRLTERKTLLAQLDTLNRSADRQYGDYQKTALALLDQPAARRAFDLHAEPPAVRDRYGRSRFGQSCLLARRMIEADVSLVQVNWTRLANVPNNGTWDTHAKNAETLNTIMPIVDAAYAALLSDLAERGLLDDTLVVWMGEFGRTPKHNANAGRDHWGGVFSLALAGGGIRPGVVHGASDALGAQAKEGLVRPEDLTATIFHLLGYAPDTELTDPLGRPVPISRGNVIQAVLA